MILGAFGPWQVVLIVVVALLLFGGKKIPELMKGMGKGVKMFKQGMTEMEEEVKRPLDDQPSQQPTEQQPNQDGK